MMSYLLSVIHDTLLLHTHTHILPTCPQPPWITTGQLSGLLANLPSAIRAVVQGGDHDSGCVRWSLEYLASAASEWLADASHGPRIPDFKNIMEDSDGDSPLIAGSQLVSLACSIPLLSEWSFLSDSVLLVERIVCASPSAPIKVALLQHIHDLLLLSDDYARKGLLSEWFQKLHHKHNPK